jgi:hypothetical protein
MTIARDDGVPSTVSSPAPGAVLGWLVDYINLQPWPGFAVPRGCNNHLYFRILSRRPTGKNLNYCDGLSFSA